jgi:hypothetical protein
MGSCSEAISSQACCVAALTSEERQLFGLAPIVDELRPLKRFAGVE